MREFWRFLGYNVLPIACVVGAVVLAVMDKSGWGWLLLMACFFGVMPSTGGDE